MYDITENAYKWPYVMNDLHKTPKEFLECARDGFITDQRRLETLSE